MCCTRLAENTGRKNSPKIRHLRTIAQLYRVMSSQLTHVSAIGKKLLNSNISSTFPHNMVVNFGSLMAEIGWRVWGTQQSSAGFASWFSYCTDVAQRRSTKLCTMFGRLLDWYIFGGSCPLMEFCQVHKSLCVHVLRSPVLAALLRGIGQWASAKFCGVVFSRDSAAIRFDIGRSNLLVFILTQFHQFNWWINW